VIALVLALVAALAPVPAQTCWETAWRCEDIVDYRTDHDLAGLDQTAVLQETAKSWARTMAADGVLRHSPAALRGEFGGEIVGTAPDWRTVMAAWDQSDPHRDILTDPGLSRVGIGVARDDTGRLWAVVVFR
jgi:uncharacterized protein YkwD